MKIWVDLDSITYDDVFYFIVPPVYQPESYEEIEIESALLQEYEAAEDLLTRAQEKMASMNKKLHREIHARCSD